MAFLRFGKRLLATAVVLSLFLLGGGLTYALGNNPLLSFMLMGTFVVHMSSGPRTAERIWTVGCAVLFREIYGAAKGFHPYFGSSVVSWGGFLGLASLVILLVQMARSQGPPRKARLTTLLTAGALPYAWVIVAFSLGTITHTSRTLDANLLAFDSSLGMPFSFVLGRWLAASPLLAGLTLLVYHALPLGGASMLAWYNQSRFRPVKVIHLYLSVMVVGFAAYWLYPAAGPMYAYAGSFPWNAPAKWAILALPVAPFDAPRNAMPSLHFGAMLLLMWNSRAWPRWGRLAALCFTLAVAFSTVALGEHYLIDLVVAFPFILGMQAAWSAAVPLRAACRWQALLAGFGGTGAWFLALRWAIPLFLSFPVLAWACVAATVGGALWMERRLADEAWRHDGEEAPVRVYRERTMGGSALACNFDIVN
jgi:hypothetical protein